MHLPDTGKALLVTIVAIPFIHAMSATQHVGALEALARGTHMIKLPDAQFDFKPFELKNLCYECDRSRDEDLYSCTMKFDWFDPNSVRENNVSACSCKYSWKWDSVTLAPGDRNSFDAEGYSVCQINHQTTTFFEMKINSFHAADNFTLSLGRRYRDTVLFQPPFVYPTTFAEPVIQLSQQGRKDERSIQYYEPDMVKADIMGLMI
ncbi:hypothetical protein RB594_002669 [Gaeumannomyces avenae]